MLKESEIKSIAVVCGYTTKEGMEAFYSGYVQQRKILAQSANVMRDIYADDFQNTGSEQSQGKVVILTSILKDLEE